ncbi:LysR family transcriptional regulator, partial [Micromonospora sp. NPDC005313]
RRRDVVPTHAGRELRRILLEYVHDATATAELPPGVEPL